MKHLFQKSGAPPYSEARARLAGLIERRDAASAAIADRQIAIGRIESEMAIGDAAAGQLAALDSADAAALAAWARPLVQSEPAPSQDVERRELLVKRAAEAASRAVALTRAHAELIAEHATEAAAIPAIAQQIEETVELVMLEESAPLVEALRLTNVALASGTARLDALARIFSDRAPLQVVHSVAVQGPSAALATLISEVKGKALAPPAPDDDGASQSRLAWLALASALRADATARLES